MEGNKEVHVICCNDSVEYAVVGDIEKARLRLIALRDADIETKGLGSHLAHNEDEWKKRVEQYNQLIYWNIYTVKGE